MRHDGAKYSIRECTHGPICVCSRGPSGPFGIIPDLQQKNGEQRTPLSRFQGHTLAREAHAWPPKTGYSCTLCEQLITVMRMPRNFIYLLKGHMRITLRHVYPKKKCICHGDCSSSQTVLPGQTASFRCGPFGLCISTCWLVQYLIRTKCKARPLFPTFLSCRAFIQSSHMIPSLHSFFLQNTFVINDWVQK